MIFVRRRRSATLAKLLAISRSGSAELRPKTIVLGSEEAWQSSPTAAQKPC